jgi:uncharacterized protein (TIGR04255 family)
VETRYERAPITEALIDIRVEPLPSTMLHALEDIHTAVKDQFPEKQRRVQLESRFSGGEEVGAMARQEVVGFVFRSSAAGQIFQARLDGFTCSRLRPYGKWSELRDQAQSLWSIYRKVIGPRKIIRVAVRYINQIDIPARDLDYRDYFLTTPEVSPRLPQGLSGFFMQLQMPQPDFGGMLILTQSTVAPSAPDTNAVILDLDVIKEGPEFASESEVWDLLEVLRNRKNEYFEGCLTDRTRALFGERVTY